MKAKENIRSKRNNPSATKAAASKMLDSPQVRVHTYTYVSRNCTKKKAQEMFREMFLENARDLRNLDYDRYVLCDDVYIIIILYIYIYIYYIYIYIYVYIDT